MNRTALAIVFSAITAVAVLLGIVVWALWPDNDATSSNDTSPAHSSNSNDQGSDHDHAITDPFAPENANIDAATEQAFRTMFTWQPVSDSSPGDAVLRAQPWLGGKLAAASGRDTDVRPPSDWQAWKRSGDLVSATAAVTDTISTTGTRAVRHVAVVQSVMRPTGDTTAYATFTVRAELSHANNGWRVTTFTVLPGD